MDGRRGITPGRMPSIGVQLEQRPHGAERPRWRVGVVVPARDEARTIEACLRSVLVAASEAGGLIDAFTVVVVADSCTDATATLARGSSHRIHVAELRLGAAGAARATGSDIAVARLGGTLDRIWLANTDADSVVPPDWLTRQLGAASDGFVGVAGIVDLAGGEELLQSSFRTTYSTGIEGSGHRHVHGANLGVRADDLYRVGNWSACDTGEDHELWNRLCGAGRACLADAALVVSTSSRLFGRAPSGFAADLARLAGLAPTHGEVSLREHVVPT